MGPLLFIVFLVIGLMVLNIVMENKRREKFGIPKKGKKIKYYEGYNKPFTKQVYYWLDESGINICSSKSKTNSPLRIAIPKLNVIGFAQVGDLTTKISGGGIGFGGAAVGGLLLGPVGAIIGSRKKVKSTNVDTRQVVLNFKEDGVEKAMLLDHLIYKDLCLACSSKKIA